ncbi:uncharacterized protein LOC109124009 [Vitis vinifera]|uniref:uncharacterized protein LOC109124009 n=1 Tax=Vitis vinifera TaxID=29760 RepID=UPI0008FEC32D|nr:uncharacterized protein LOC109124009 [Vitis vinifera]|eukprot:XP_019081044.1 PREDICTED: uncharacterized protein LOC109124009 [Vitis vinifera]
MSARFRKVTDWPETLEPAIPTPEPTENPDEWITCNHCSQRLISSQNVRGVVVQARDPSASYHVAEDVANIFHLDDVVHLGYKRIRAENQETDLTLARVYCCTCRLPAGWKVLQRSESHPIVHVDDFLLYVPPPPLPPSES